MAGTRRHDTMITLRRWAIVGVVLVWHATAAAAQGHAPTVDLAGTVRDQTNAPLADVSLAATDPATGLTRIATSGADGRFTVAALPVGRYTLRAERAGFSALLLTDLVLTLGKPMDIDLVMQLASIEAVVTVEAHPGLDVSTAVSSTIGQRRIEDLPTNRRNFIAFASLTPGVSPDQTPQQGASRTSGLTFAGQRGRSNNVTVDGLDNNDETVGSVRAAFSQEAVQEFQVLTNSFSAEFGRASAGIVNIVTKSGTNNFSGNAFGFLRDQGLNAKGYFERFNSAGRPVDQPKAPFGQQQFGGTFGGPLKKDRSFFFVSFERLNSQASNFVTIDDQTVVRSPFDPAVVLGTPAGILRNAGFPVETGNVPYDAVGNQFLFKADAALSPGHRVNLRLNTATELNENIEPFGGLVSKSRAASLQSTDIVGAVADTLVLSPRFVNELRGQVAARNQVVQSLDPTCGGECLGEAQGGPTLEVAGVASVGRQRFTPTYRDNTRYQIVDTASFYRGAHLLRAGFDSSFIDGRHQTLPLHFGGRYIFQDAALPLIQGQPPIPISGIQEVALGLPLAYVQGYGNSGAGYNTADLSLFAQDEWRLGPAFTLNAGLRYQTQFWSHASFQPAGYPGTYEFPSDRNDVAPRIAVAWVPGSDRRTAIHAAYGIYYDNQITSLFGITKFINGTDGVRTLVLRAPGSFVAWGAPGHQLSESQALALTGGAYPSVAITIDPSLKTPHAHHLSAGVTREFAQRTTLAASFVFVRGLNQPATIDYNPLVPSLGPGRRPADVGGMAGTSASVLQYTSFGQTWYRGLLVSIDKRFSDSSQLLVSYTLSSAEDNSTDFQSSFLPQNNGLGRNPADPNGLPIGFNPDDERGPSLQDQRHRLVVSGAWIAPAGLQVSGILTVESGRPYNVLAGADLNGDGDGGNPATDRARANPADPSTSVSRNVGTLPPQATLDVRVARRFRPSRRVTVDPMIEMFNLFNRTNFTSVQNVFGIGQYPTNPLPTFGQFTQAGPPFQAQLSIKVGF